MAGKYVGVVDALPKLVEHGPDYQTEVDNKKTEIIESGKTTAAALAEEYVLMRGLKKEQDEITKAYNLRLEALKQLLCDVYEVQGIHSMKLQSGGSIRTQVEPYASVEDRDAVRQWAVDSGLERSLTLPWMTLNSYTKERLLNGDPAPPGVKVFCLTKLIYTKG